MIYELSCENKEETIVDDKIIFDQRWIAYCFRKYSKILIVDYKNQASEVTQKSGKKVHISIDVVQPKNFNFSNMEKYDLIIDLEIEKYEARQKLLLKEHRAYINNYTNPQDLLFRIGLKDFFARIKENNIAMLFYEAPTDKKLNFLSEEQLERINSKYLWYHYFKDKENYESDIKEIYEVDDYDNYIKNIFNLPLPIRKNGAITYEDSQSDFCNVVDGYRVTEHKQYENYTNKIEVFGPCIVFGQFVDDSRTIQSYLQEKLNKSSMNYYDVRNMGLRAGSLREYTEIIKGRSYKNGDIIIFVLLPDEVEYLRKMNKELEVTEISDYFNEHYKEIGNFFLDNPIHCNHKANQLIAQILFEGIHEYHNKNGRVKGSEKEVFLGGREQNDSFDTTELMNYVEQLKETVHCGKDDTVGSIVMNCNPFTMGHEYLVEYASKMVDVLIVFVVEEDKSVFPFTDRIELVRKGCEKFKNVVVVPSGKYIISSITFPEYFIKGEMGNGSVELDMSMDLDIFMDYIAKGVGIQYRFVGEEPMDMVTRQYNESMKNKLPKAGIKVVEILERKAKTA